MIKKTLIAITTVSYLFALTGCATMQYKGNGQVLSAKKISEQNHQPHETTKNGALIGGTAGAAGGAVYGGLIGCIWSVFATESILGAAALTITGSAIGALAFGAAGSMVGAGTGYLVDKLNHAATYQYTVKPSYQADTITITQYASPIPVNANVRILEKNHAIYIERTASNAFRPL